MRLGKVPDSLALGICAALSAASQASSTHDAIVIGAGFAGLAASSHLCENGYSVLLLEARDRTGGRAHTGRVDGLNVELGAGWIHGSDATRNSIQNLANVNAVGTAPGEEDTRSAWRVSRSSATAVSAEEVDQWATCAEDFISHVASNQDVWEEDRSMRHRFDAWLSSQDLSPEAQEGCTAIVESDHADIEYGASLAQLSSWEFGEGEALIGVDTIILPEAGGYTALARKLEERTLAHASCRIRTGAPVTDIDRDESGVSATLASGEVVRGRVGVVTIPLGVLKANSVSFTPPLPTAKRNAIDRLGFGLLNKVILRYSTNFWAAAPGGSAAWMRPVIQEGDSSTAPLPQGAALEFWNGDAFGLPSTIVLLVGAHLADSWEEEATDSAMVSRADALVRAMFGTAVGDATVVGSAVTRWRADPWALGSYSYLPPYASPADRRRVCDSDGGVLFWAGEHCSVANPAMTHGALDSGTAAGQAAAAALGEPASRQGGGENATLVVVGVVVGVVALLAVVAMALRRHCATRRSGAGTDPADAGS